MRHGKKRDLQRTITARYNFGLVVCLVFGIMVLGLDILSIFYLDDSLFPWNWVRYVLTINYGILAIFTLGYLVIPEMIEVLQPNPPEKDDAPEKEETPSKSEKTPPEEEDTDEIPVIEA